MHPDLKALLTLNRVPSTLLIVGEAFEAYDFAKELLGSQLFDFHSYTLEGKSALHSFEKMGELIEELSLPPYSSPCKVFLIEDAERMLPSSANALLKSLEEPPEDTYLILTTSRPSLMLPTLLSRCWKIEIPSHQIEEEIAIPLLDMLSKGSDALYPSLYKTLLSIEELLEKEETPSLRQKKIDALFTSLSTWFRDRHLLSSQGPLELLHHKTYLSKLKKLKTPFPSLDTLPKLIGLMFEALQLNIKPRLVLETFFLKIHQNSF